MPRPKSENSKQTAIRLPPEVISRADALIPHLTKTGLQVTRADALRVLLFRGLASVESEGARKKQLARLQEQVRRLSRTAEKFVIDEDANSDACKSIKEIESILLRMMSEP